MDYSEFTQAMASGYYKSVQEPEMIRNPRRYLVIVTDDLGESTWITHASDHMQACSNVSKAYWKIHGEIKIQTTIHEIVDTQDTYIMFYTVVVNGNDNHDNDTEYLERYDDGQQEQEDFAKDESPFDYMNEGEWE